MDDKLSRRGALGAFGAVTFGGLLAACGDDAAPTARTVPPSEGATSPTFTAADFASAARCEVATESIEGPYYFDVDAIRRDLREDREGTVLRLGIRVRDASSCEPIENAIVDVWHCDALGLYSGFESASTGGGSSSRTDDETYLRGAQATDRHGISEFTTIYPGWYPGRTTHIHAKVHLDRKTLLTTQLYTTKDVDAKVYADPPYDEDPGRDAFNDSDGFYDASGELTLAFAGDEVTGLITLDVRQG